jgi:hypothetical protein
MTRLATAGLAGHVFFELAAGVGMPLASVLGPMPAAGLWAVTTAGVWRAAASRPASSDATLALWNGLGLAAVLAHLAAWPRRRTRLGLPWLEDCEGLGPELMPWYNPTIYLSGVAALLALATENRSASRRLPLLVLGLTPALMAFQHAEHQRLLHQAGTRPGWWNRRLQRTSEDGGRAVGSLERRAPTAEQPL